MILYKLGLFFIKKTANLELVMKYYKGSPSSIDEPSSQALVWPRELKKAYKTSYGN